MKKNRDYTFKVYKDEFDDWVCEYTDIPGMIGVGETKEDAIREADLFLNAYLDELDKEGREDKKEDVNKMKEYFIYDDEVYESEEAVDEAIIEKIGHNYNNIDVTQTSEFQDEIQNIEIVTVDGKKENE